MSGFVIDVIAFAVVVLVCVGIHEFGHFVFAKISGIRVDEFSIGFGPRLVSRQWGETRYSLRALPLGGYVRMAGMLGLPGEADAGSRNFYRASIPRRLLVMVAGVAFNLILAFVLLSIVAMAPSPSLVAPGTPAYAAGLRSGSSIVAIDGHRVDHSSAASVTTDVSQLVNNAQGRPLTVVYRDSGGTSHTTTITPVLSIENFSITDPNCSTTLLPEGLSYVSAVNGKPVGYGPATGLIHTGDRVSGVAQDAPCQGMHFTDVTVTAPVQAVSAAAPAPQTSCSSGTAAPVAVLVDWKVGVQLDFNGLSLGPALAAAGQTVASFVPQTVSGLVTLACTPNSGGITGPNGLQGPVGIAQTAGATVQQGILPALSFIGFVSLNLGYLNLVPIPYLDGGKILLVLIEAVRRKRLAPEKEALIYAIGLAILVILILFITIGDLRHA